MFKVGFGRVDITPTESVPLAGYGNTSARMSTNVLDPLYSSCAAITDDCGTTVLLFHNDLISAMDPFSVPCREAIRKATGIPYENIMICTTHTHSGPDGWNRAEPSIPRWLDTLPGLLTQCATDALADRKEVTAAYQGKVHTKGLNFVRHYMLEDGHYRGDNFGVQYDSPFACHTTQADPEMRLVKFVRKDGKDVILVNWQVHPLTTSGSRKPDISADLVGAFREEMEKALDCHFAYFLGGAGNLSHYSKIPGEIAARTREEFGVALKDHALSVSYAPLKLDTIKVAFLPYEEEANILDLSRLEEAKKVVDFWKSTDNGIEAAKFAVEHGFSSQYEASSAINRANSEERIVALPLHAISMGDFGFGTTPCETFDTNVKYVRDFSPFPMTFVSTCTNGSQPYVPSAYGFIHGCYESATTKCKPGAAERMAQKLLNLLRSIR